MNLNFSVGTFFMLHGSEENLFPSWRHCQTPPCGRALLTVLNLGSFFCINEPLALLQTSQRSLDIFTFKKDPSDKKQYFCQSRQHVSHLRNHVKQRIVLSQHVVGFQKNNEKQFFWPREVSAATHILTMPRCGVAHARAFQRPGVLWNISNF